MLFHSFSSTSRTNHFDLLALLNFPTFKPVHYKAVHMSKIMSEQLLLKYILFGFYFFFIWQLWYYVAFLGWGGVEIMCVGCIRLSHELPILNHVFTNMAISISGESQSWHLVTCTFHLWVAKLPSEDMRYREGHWFRKRKGSSGLLPTSCGLCALHLFVPQFLYLYNDSGLWVVPESEEANEKTDSKVLRKD